MIIPVMLGVVFIVFVMLYVLPGPTVNQIPSYGGGDMLDVIFKTLNAENSVGARYIRYCFNAFIRFDFGLPGTYFIAARVRLTLILVSLGVAAALIIGGLAGVYTAIHHNKWQDHAIMFFVLLFSSIPSFCIAVVLCSIFAVALQVLPLFGISTPAHYILPTLTLSAGGIATMTRITRASMLEVLSQSYIIALRSKGLKERIVVYLHALRNSLIPVLSMLGTLAAQILFNSFVVEIFFTIPGIGSFLLEAVEKRNHTAVLCSAVIITTILSVVFIATDLLYTLVNPRIKLEYIKHSRKNVKGGSAG